jgi:hypothetical protein
MMKGSLTDELDATIHEIERLTEQWEQAQAYERALVRLRFLSSNIETLLEAVRRARSSSAHDTWSHMSQVLWRERPRELAAVGRALTTEDASFLRVVSYLGFVRGMLAALDVTDTDDVPPASDESHNRSS